MNRFHSKLPSKWAASQVSPMWKLNPLCCLCVLALTALTERAFAQYMYIDANGDGINSTADSLNPAGSTVLTIYLNTNHDKDGSLQTCNSHTAASCGATPTAQPLTMFSYQIYLTAVGGTVTWGTFTPDSSAYSTLQSQIQDTHDVEFTFQRQPPGTASPPGLSSLGKIPVTITSGSPRIRFARYPNTPLDPNSFGTTFGTNCQGFVLGNTYVLGDRADPCGTAGAVPGDWFDAGGIGNPPPPPVIFPPIGLLASGFRMYDVGLYPDAIAVGDLNSDGRQDLVLANQGSNSITVLLAGGDGTFRTFLPGVSYGTGSTPFSVALGNLNGDTYPDVVVGNYGENPGTVSVFLGSGTGVLGTRADFSTGGANPTSVALSDLNGDGKRDIVVANSFSANVGVLIGNGSGTFAFTSVYPVGAFPTSIVLTDLDKNGALDLAVSDFNAGR